MIKDELRHSFYWMLQFHWFHFSTLDFEELLDLTEGNFCSVSLHQLFFLVDSEAREQICQDAERIAVLIPGNRHSFMSGRPGFYEEMRGGAGAGPRVRGIPPSSSSTFHHRGLHPYPYPYPNVVGGGDESDPADVDNDKHVLLRCGGERSSSAAAIPRERMFDKVVTPSDVGKLNRLVIPKQYAEKYFPLDSTANEKGLLLNFEDRNGKPWRFRYSYWNSSQSYVMTKGWSRFVKEKRLDAGDIVSFQRGVGEIGKDRLFIDWRRRQDAREIPTQMQSFSISNQFSLHHHHHRSLHPWSPLFPNPPPRDYLQFLQANNHPSASIAHHSRPYHHHHHHLPAGYGPYAYNNVVNGNPCLPGSILYLRSGGECGGGGIPGPQRGGGVGDRVVEQMVFESVPVVHGKAAAKRLRLFGVNMDCPISDSEDGDIIMSPSTNSSTITLPLLHQFPPPPPHFDSSPWSSSAPSDFQLRPSYSSNGTGSMSLDLDI